MRLFFTLLLLLAGFFTANAQFSETKIIDQCRPCNTKDVPSADFDTDGNLDIIVASSGSDSALAFINNGFTNPVFKIPR